MRVTSLLAVMSLLLMGCAKPGSFNERYEPPVPRGEVENEVVVDMSFEDAWAKMISKLSQSFFVLNNIEKASGFINLSYASDDGDPFVDCGRSYCTSVRGDSIKNFSFPIAKSNSFEADTGAVEWFEYSEFVKREISIDGRINIHMIPLGQNKTKITANAKYVLKKIGTSQTIARHANNPNFVNYGNVKPTNSYVVNFSTLTKGVSSDVVCYSTGMLEKKIIMMIAE